MICYHIDAARRTVSESPHRDLKGLQTLLKCDAIDTAFWIGNNVVMVDDTGLWKPQVGWWRSKYYAMPIGGDAVVFGIDDQGHDIDPTINIADLLAEIEWLIEADFQRWLLAHKNEPAISVDGQCLQTFGQLHAEVARRGSWK